ncbi:carbonic anhydrase [Cylindrobasidium torrendii FP15055 ss-10]|uniref:Carbonic anhydrase n=1 Tax=Cylindrobasidium torrendii FP15055 ss-10 TaxID=1314674 RepID=A0A0D7BSI4_9AGAR|nr:carbonic anhydrase [Cylindrobasidium torrendii FP15055 ss-10]
MQVDHPGLLQDLALNGQHPNFTILTCSDSRVAPETVFGALPGTMFTARSIANVYTDEDFDAQTIMYFGMGHLHATNIVVMGHYGCAGIAAAIDPQPEEPMDWTSRAVEKWVAPIRDLYMTSTRPEIATFRDANGTGRALGIADPVWRALAEENVRLSVNNIAKSDLLNEIWSNPSIAPLYIYGFVYDVMDGSVVDLGASRGPPGRTAPPSPFPTLL